MEAAHVLTREGIELETEREADRNRKKGKTLLFTAGKPAGNPEPTKRERTYGLSEGFTP